MNLLDLMIVALCVSAGLGGYRIGLVTRALSWFFMAIGIVVTARFLPEIIEVVNGPDPRGRLLIAIGVLLFGRSWARRSGCCSAPACIRSSRRRVATWTRPGVP